MAIRTTSKRVTFKSSFRLEEVEQELPAGTYDVDTEEEIYEGNERTVFVRVATLVRIPRFGGTRTVKIDPEGLDAALVRDQLEES